ncbi:MAG: benzoyl-CoA reductase subunit C [Alphaproteobacteria bacterium]|nr:benzoyl-CoA reductase subunit C [Alphaproteobacteria bacterium]
MATREEITDRCQALYDDLTFTAAREWKAAKDGRHVIGFMPMYVPRELIHAAGMMALGILGGGDNLEVIQGDAYYQSYICRIPRSTIELLLTDRLDFVDGMLFPSICDVIRNLSGMWKLLRPDVYSHYFDVPQNYDREVGGEFYIHELGVLKEDLKISGRKITDDDLRNSIALYNESRRLTRELYQFRADKPWLAPSSEVYLINRAGMLIPPEDHNQLIKDYIAAASEEDRPKRDNSRVVISGSFCEQPPLNLIKSIEMSGCYVVDDDYMLVNRWFTKEVPTDGDPLKALSYTFLEASVKMPSCFEPDEDNKGQFLVDSVRENNAEGVIFAATSFCDPALLERPILQDVLNDADIPHISFKYAENTGQMQPIREQAGTFADSIKLWS